MKIFFEGFLIGLGTLLLIGPVVFTLLQASINKGWKGGVAVAIGIITADIIYVSLGYLGLLTLLTSWLPPLVQQIAGVLMLFLFALYFWFSKVSDKSSNLAGMGNLWKMFVAGFLINFVNPAVLAIWVGLSSYTFEAHQRPFQQLLFLAAILMGIFIVDLLKVGLASFIKRWLNLKRQIIIKRVAAVLFLIIGIKLSIDIFLEFN